MKHTLRDIIRSARRRPAFSLAVLATLGIGIGVATPVLTLVDALLIRPLPFPAADRVTGVWFASPNLPGGLPRVRQSVATYLHVRDRSRTFSAFGLAEQSSVTLEVEGAPARLDGAVVTADIFSVLGVGMLAGRPFTAEDNAPGAPATVILTEPFWRSRFGADPGVVGRELLVDGVSRTVVGILPTVAFPTAGTQLWLPLLVDPDRLEGTSFVYTGYGRLKPGIDLTAAGQDFDRLIQLLPEAYPGTFPRPLLTRLQLTASFSLLQQELVGDSRQTLLIALGAVILVLVIVVANVATLFLVRGESRRRENAVRMALGALPERMVGAALLEGVGYALAGATLGLAIGGGGLVLLRRMAPEALPRIGQAVIDARAVGVVLLLAVMVGLVVGLMPALRHRGMVGHASALREGVRGIGDRRDALRLRWALVAGQVALGLTLLVNAGVLVRSLSALTTISPGFVPDGVLGARLFLSARDYPEFSDVRRFYQRVVDEVRELPGVEQAGAVSFLPLRDGRIFHPWQVEGAQVTGELPVPILTKLVTDGYLETLRVSLLQGRRLDREDVDEATGAVVVSEEVARQFWPGEDPLGRRLRVGGVTPGDTDGAEWFHVVGVVAGVRDRDLTQPSPPIIYVPLNGQLAAGDRRWREISLAVRSASGPSALGPRIRTMVAGLDPRVPVADVRSMSQVLRDVTGRARYTMLLVLAVAVAAVFLAGVGIFGVLSHVVTDRRREMAVRLALGATPTIVRRMILRQAALLALAGAILGAIVTALGSRLTATVLYGVAPSDPTTLAAVAAVLGLVTWIAARVPAMRAAAVPPAAVLAGD